MEAGQQGREEYRECLRNHAARLGVHTVDGCTEYTADAAKPVSLYCTACGCHRNFHRKVLIKTSSSSGSDIGAAQRLLGAEQRSEGKKRTRTKFSAEQKMKMASFAEKIGWTLRRSEEDEVSQFCREIGVTRQVFKVWLHNHKNSSAAAAAATTSSTSAATDTSDANADADTEGNGDAKDSTTS